MARRIKVLLAAAALLLGVAGCGISLGPPTDTTPTGVVIEGLKVPGLGTILVNQSGFPLYVFAPDHATKVTCSASCQSVWPPVNSPRRGVAHAAPGVEQALIGSAPNPIAHNRIVTYDGWPLYSYVSDEAQGQPSGQNTNLNGGYWWVIDTDGKVVKSNFVGEDDA
jgi:predicted lipoprotein with Yx(FWY)xxD motif